jgi:hypothetical protein
MANLLYKCYVPVANKLRDFQLKNFSMLSTVDSIYSAKLKTTPYTLASRDFLLFLDFDDAS